LRETAAITEAVERALGVFSEAIQQKDEAQLRGIWPTIPTRALNDWESVFKNARSVEMQLRPRAEPDISGSTARVDCDSTTRKVYSDTAQAYTTTGVVHIILRKQGTIWLIESMR
jgi:hypothetical protein